MIFQTFIIFPDIGDNWVRTRINMKIIITITQFTHSATQKS